MKLIVPLIASVAAVSAATPTPTPVHVTVSDLVGEWKTVSGVCPVSGHLLAADGDYRMWCFDSLTGGRWLLRGGNKIVVKPDPKKSYEEIITIVGFDRHDDRTFLFVRAHDASREKWFKVTGLTNR